MSDKFGYATIRITVDLHDDEVRGWDSKRYGTKSFEYVVPAHGTNAIDLNALVAAAMPLVRLDYIEKTSNLSEEKAK